MMRGNIITFGDQKMNFDQFCAKVEGYDLELTRSDIVEIIKDTEDKNPSLIPALLNVVKNTYHINMTV